MQEADEKAIYPERIREKEQVIESDGSDPRKLAVCASGLPRVG